MKGMCWVWGDGAERKESFVFCTGWKRLWQSRVREGGAACASGKEHVWQGSFPCQPCFPRIKERLGKIPKSRTHV